MKNTDEIAEYVFKKRDEILEKRRKIKNTVMVSVSAAACISIIVATNVNTNNKMPDNNYIADINEVTDYTSSSVITGSDKNTENDTTNSISESEITESGSQTTGTENTENGSQTSYHSSDVSKTFEKTSEKPYIQTVYSEPSVTKIPSSVTEIPKTTSDIPADTSVRYKPDAVVTERPVTTTAVQSDAPVTETSAVSSELPPETAVIPPWNELEISEKFINLFYDGTEYYTKCFKTESSQIDVKLGDTVIEGQDFQTMEMYQAYVTVFTLKSISKECAVAVRFENSPDYYVYTARNYFPDNMNELLNNISYEENISFGDLYINHSTVKAESYDKDLLMNIIKENRTADCVTDDSSHKVIYSISTSINNLGIKSKSTGMTEDGWLIMNIMDWRYSFYIGTDAVSEFGKTVKAGADNGTVYTDIVQEME